MRIPTIRTISIIVKLTPATIPPMAEPRRDEHDAISEEATVI
jgi:hypothetical protein